MTSYHSLIAQLKKEGFRITKIRQAILKELDNAKKPLSALDIMNKLNEKGISSHKTSIYREIYFLLNNQFVNKVNFGEKIDRYELIRGTEHYHHVICEKCGNVENIECFEGIDAIKKMLENRDFYVSRHTVEFFGLCKNCK